MAPMRQERPLRGSTQPPRPREPLPLGHERRVLKPLPLTAPRIASQGRHLARPTALLSKGPAAGTGKTLHAQFAVWIALAGPAGPAHNVTTRWHIKRSPRGI